MTAADAGHPGAPDTGSTPCGQRCTDPPLRSSMEPSAPPRRVTIVDVAKHAKVSTTAVSKVLRNAYGVSPSMQAKVREAMTELGYRPHAAARGLRGQTYTLGVMVPDIYNPFFPQIINGLTERLRGTDYQVLVGPADCGHETEAQVTEALI